MVREMSKPYLQQIAVECWEHPCKLGHSQPTVCLFHNEVDLGRPILIAFDELQAEGPPAQRAISFKPSSRRRCLLHMKLRLVPSSEGIRVLHIRCDNATAVLEMTEIGLQLLRSSVAKWCSGFEDFGIAPDHAGVTKRQLGPQDTSSGELWFWGPTIEP